MAPLRANRPLGGAACPNRPGGVLPAAAHRGSGRPGPLAPPRPAYPLPRVAVLLSKTSALAECGASGAAVCVHRSPSFSSPVPSAAAAPGRLLGTGLRGLRPRTGPVAGWPAFLASVLRRPCRVCWAAGRRRRLHRSTLPGVGNCGTLTRRRQLVKLAGRASARFPLRACLSTKARQLAEKWYSLGGARG